jgi:hypothetical protein
MKSDGRPSPALIESMRRVARAKGLARPETLKSKVASRPEAGVPRVRQGVVRPDASLRFPLLSKST